MNGMNPVWLALITALSATVGPLLLAWHTNHQRRLEKKEDWERQDRLADQAQKAAQLLLVNTEKVAQATVIQGEKLDKVVEIQGAKLEQIHTLVNSNLTAAVEAKDAALRTSLAALEEIITLKKAAGQEPAEAALFAVENTRKLIAESEAQLAERKKQTEIGRQQFESAQHG